MKYIFKPVKVAETLTLYEALYWVAFKIYAVDKSIYSIDFKKDLKLRRCFFPYEEYAKILEPESRLLKDIFEQCPGSLEYDFYNMNLSDARIEFAFPESEEAKQQQVKHDLFKEQISKNNRLFSEAKTKLLLELAKGSIQAIGHKNAWNKPSSNMPPWKWENEQDWEPGELWKTATNPDNIAIPQANSTFTRRGYSKLLCSKIDNYSIDIIPHDFWNTEGVMWDEDAVRSSKGEYTEIKIRTGDLFRIFPEEKGTQINVERRGGTIILNDNEEPQDAPNLKPRGRPPIENLPEVYADALQYIINAGGKIDKQQALEAYLNEERKKRKEKHISHSSFHNALKPIYERFKNKKSEKAAS